MRVGMQHVLSDDAVRRPFDPEVVVDTDCMITTYQNVYYFAESFVDAKNKLRYSQLSTANQGWVQGWVVRSSPTERP